MLVRIHSIFRRNIDLIKKNFNKTVPVISSLEHRNMNFGRKMTFFNPALSLQGNNPLNKAPILFRAATLYSIPRCMGLASIVSKNYSSQPGHEEKEKAETAHFEIGKVLEFARSYKQQASSGNHLNRRKLLELYGFALNLARKFGSKQAKNLETELIEIIKVFLWEELRIKQDVAVANLAQSMTLFKEKLKNIRLTFRVNSANTSEITELTKKNSRAQEELLQWMFEQVKELLGPPPCRFAMVSLGSLARGMASPYSDVEYFILVESSAQKNRNYFQNFADVFDFLMIGFGESPIVEARDLLHSDPSLSEVYKRFKKGIRLDEHKKPQDFNRLLGLITTDRELLEDLPKEVIHQSGNHLTAALFSTKYLWGDKGLHHEYQKLFSVAIETREYFDCIQKLLKQDINVAKTQKLLLENTLFEKSESSFELKPLLTVVTQLAEGLASLLKIRGEKLGPSTGTLEILHQLQVRHYLTEVQDEIWQKVLKTLLQVRFKVQQETESAEASISVQDLEKAIPVSKLCGALQTMIEIVEAQLNQGSQPKNLAALKEVLQSQALSRNHLYAIYCGLAIFFVAVYSRFGKKPGANDMEILGEVPRQDNFFVERKDLSEALQQKLQSFEVEKNSNTKIVVCIGLGGVGKTQFLLNYFLNPKQAYAYKAWFRADNIVSLEQSYRELAKVWGFLDKNAKIEAVIKYVKRHLSEHPRWLFVYDNVNSYEELAPFLPDGQGTIIISTRHQPWPESFQRLPIPVMSPSESLEMIGTLSGRKINAELKEAEELAKALGYLPLALAQASSYIKETQNSIAGYLERYKKWEAELLAEGILPQVGKEVRSLPVAITWNISLEEILEKEKSSSTPVLALELLTICSYLSPDKIPEAYLLTWLKLTYPQLRAPELRLEQCLRTLVQYSMIEHQEQDFVGIHRLVQTVLRAQQQSSHKKLPYPALTFDWYKALLTASLDFFYHKTQVLEDERRKTQLLPHLENLIKHYDKLWSKETNSPVLARVLAALGRGCLELGKPGEAKLHYERALKIFEGHYGKEHVEVAKTLHNLGNAHVSLGEVGQAKELYERALKIEENHYGKEHVAMAKTLSNLGTVHAVLGEVGQAKELYERALKIQESHYGREHVEVAVTLMNLGTVHRDLGGVRQAKELYERALKIQESHYGKEHISVGTILDNLGTAHHDLGEVVQAKELYERALKIEESHYGREHVEVAVTLMNLGTVHRDLGEVGQAKELYERALKIQEGHYGREHFEVAGTLVNLGNAYYDLGEVVQAKELYERALKIKEGHYGSKHFKVAGTLDKLGTVHRDLGEVVRAKELYERALMILESHYGKEHVEVAGTLNNLGLVHYDLGEHEEAKRLWMRASMICRKHYPENHPLIQIVLRNLKKLGLEPPFDSLGTKPSKPTSSASFVPQFQTATQVMRDLDQQTHVLSKAVEEGQEEVVKQLLGNSQVLDINATDLDSGRTALHLAVIHRRKGIVALLVQAGAQQDIPDKHGKTAAVYALESGDQEIITSLQAGKSSSRPKT